MADDFKRLNNPKQACHYCAPFRGENTGLRPQKALARRHARHTLRRLDREVLMSAPREGNTQ